MRNPFEYGGVVSGEAFCNRQTEVADLLRAMQNTAKLFVFSERRYGKDLVGARRAGQAAKESLRVRLRGFVADGQRGHFRHRRIAAV